MVGVAQSASDQTPTQAPTVAGAQAFIDRANTELLKLNTDTSHAQWTAMTHITGDTQATSALLNEQYTARALALTAESHRWDKVTLPPSLRRQMMLLQLNAPAAPSDPKLLAEQMELAAELTAMYGEGKFCPDPASGQGDGTAFQMHGHRRDFCDHGEIARSRGADQTVDGLARDWCADA